MNERIISIESYSPLEIYGPNDRYLNLIKDRFPKLKIIARGDVIKIIGEKSQIDLFDRLFGLLLVHYDEFGKITENDLFEIFGNDQEEDENNQVRPIEGNDILVYGNHGLQVRARTVNQRMLVESSQKNDMVFAIGPAGTGKTYTAVALAVKALKNREVKRIILTRPAVEAGENLGFLPGDLKDKLDPYLQPLYDALRDMLPTQKLLTYLEDGTIEVAPLAFMRGRTLDHAFAILDEAQNATLNQLKMFLTRMGRNAKFIITGDITQIDLPPSQKSGLIHATQILKGIQGIDFVFLDERDIVRHRLVKDIVEAYGHDNAQHQTNNTNKT
ncbi:MAG: PhoH family protein [Bacteroidetes bacterium 38_7]|nr:MAG: PhoH family protein [Bacteroidetes bacterium 38_7]HAL65577.1 phosphate starvation-inducible protein PhoH [Bacteroidales bacterium]